MRTRRELLTQLFRLLEERRVVYCVLRNYENLFATQASDIDLLTLPEQAAAVVACCQRAGEVTGHVLVQQARFVNHSLVFWNGEESFVRIDVDTEKRWKRYHLLTAAQILATRRRWENFYVPDAANEAVVVLTQALWQGKLSERYAKRLMTLRSELGEAENLSTIFDEAFGLRENLLAAIEDPSLPKRLAGAARSSVFRRPAKTFCYLGYGFKDAARLGLRRKSPPGLFVRMVGMNKTLAEELVACLAILFPAKKSLIAVGPIPDFVRKRTMFKGGLAIELLPPVPKPAALLRDRWPELNRSFAVVADADGNAQFIHIGSGYLAPGNSAAALTKFIGTCLARLHRPESNKPRGVFVVLVGLDGAGKTTLARNLAHLAKDETTISGVRYFHWLPPLGKRVEFPLRESGNQPRKTKRANGAIQSTLSVLRLLKNLLHAHLAWWLRLRWWRQRGYLVLLDRYFYNYYLDPVSVKYSGPHWILNTLSRLFPKPEIVITLTAPPEVLLQRKQELSEAEMREQAAILKQLRFATPRVIASDAGESAAVVAKKTMDALKQMRS